MVATPALLIAAGGVGFGHAVLPDHWLPLAVVSRTRRYRLPRVARLAGLAGVAHVLVSILLGAVIVIIGLQLRSRVQTTQDTIVGAILIGTGVAFLAWEAAGRGHGRSHQQAHHGHDHHHPAEPRSRLGSLAAIMVPFGAAASPDLTILPVFLAASAAGPAAAVESLLVFGAATIATIVGLTVAATVGGYQLRSRWLDRWGNALTAGVLIVIGALVLAGVL